MTSRPLHVTSPTCGNPPTATSAVGVRGVVPPQRQIFNGKPTSTKRHRPQPEPGATTETRRRGGPGARPRVNTAALGKGARRAPARQGRLVGPVGFEPTLAGS